MLMNIRKQSRRSCSGHHKEDSAESSFFLPSTGLRPVNSLHQFDSVVFAGLRPWMPKKIASI